MVADLFRKLLGLTFFFEKVSQSHSFDFLENTKNVSKVYAPNTRKRFRVFEFYNFIFEIFFIYKIQVASFDF